MNKLLRHTDLAFHGLIMLALVWSFMQDEVVWEFILMLQFATGMFQLTSASFHALKHDFKYPLNLRLNQYWIGVFIYSVLLLLAHFFWNHVTFKRIFIFGAWFLAAYYFLIIAFKSSSESYNSIKKMHN